MLIDYTALRSIKSGHTVNLDYQIDVELQRSDKTSETIGAQAIALDGTTITTVHRFQKAYSLTTEIVSSTTTPDIDDMREFLDSVKGGETFQLDLEGTSEDYVLDSIRAPYSEQRNDPNLFRFSFKVRKL